MPRKKESSDEYEPEGLSEPEKGSSASDAEPERPEIPDELTERRAKMNRKNIVESEGLIFKFIPKKCTEQPVPNFSLFFGITQKTAGLRSLKMCTNNFYFQFF